MPVVTHEPVKLTWVENQSYVGWKKVIDGKIKYLGRDRAKAEAQALKLLAKSPVIHRPRWKSAPPPTVRFVVTTHKAIEDYMAHVRSSARVTGWKLTLKHRFDQIKLILPAMEMHELDYDRLSSVVNHYLCLPMTERGTAMAPCTAINMLRTIRQWLGWCEDSGRWEGFKRWEKLFVTRGRIKRQNKFGQIEMLALADFAKLLKNAPNQQVEATLWCAVNFGWTQSDIATFEKAMIVGDHVIRPRLKTGIPGRWKMWQGTRHAISNAMTGGNDPLVFRTEEGLPLIHYTANHKCDALVQRWYRLTRRLLGRRISFRQMRKLGAQLVREVSELETAKAYLSHTGGSVAEAHYTNPIWERLDAALLSIEGNVGVGVVVLVALFTAVLLAFRFLLG